MLRPATPLTLLLVVAFALLLLSVLSVPVTKAIAMGSFKDAQFGVFGFCKGGDCSPIGIGYATEDLLDNEKQAFNLPVNVRDHISLVLVVHPVAALLVLAVAIMAAASHLRGPAHSPRYLLILFLLIFLTFLVCVLAFIVDVLLFIPHLAMGSYMVLGATIILGLSAIASCAMRRAVVSRIAHTKRIAENIDMSGEAYFTGLEHSKPSTAFTQPTSSGANGGMDDSLPQFAFFENKQKEDGFNDEQIPLTQQGSANPYAMSNSGQASMRRAPPPRDPYALAPSAPPTAYDRGAGGGYGGPGYGRGGPGAYDNPPRDMYGSRGGQYDGGAAADAMYYDQQPPQDAYMNGYEAYNPEPAIQRSESPYNDSAMAMGQATAYDQYGRMQNEEMNMAGPAGLRQGRRHDTMMTEGSRYSMEDEYEPPRTGWTQASKNTPQDYGDVYAMYNGYDDANRQPMGSRGYDGGPAATGRARSPSESERSHLTSVSQRGVNPRWNPRNMQRPPPQDAAPRGLAVQQKQRRQDMLLDNPDFALPASRARGGTHRAGPGMVPGGAYPTTAL